MNIGGSAPCGNATYITRHCGSLADRPTQGVRNDAASFSSAATSGLLLAATAHTAAALLASAEVRLAAGDGTGAVADAQAAQRVFTAAAQLESEWRAWLVSARAIRLEGDGAKAYEYAVRAETTRAALQARWGDDNYRGYGQRPDIRVRLKELAHVLESTRSVNPRKESAHGK